MKRISVFFILLSCLMLSSCGRDENIIAKVNNKPVMKGDYEAECAFYKKINSKKFGEDLLSKVQDDGRTLEQQLNEVVLKKMICEKFIEEDMIRRNYEIKDEDLSSKGYWKKFGDEKKISEFLKANQISEEFFNASLKRAMYAERHRELIVGEMHITDDDVKKYYEADKPKFEKVNCSYILLKTEEEAKDVKTKIEAGLAFEDLALASSIDAETAAKGGELGWISRGEYPKEFEDSAFNLEVGAISDPIASDLGFYIIKVNSRKNSFNDLKEDVRIGLENEKYEEYLEAEMQKADIKVYLKTKES